jgi:hypothetical protein
MNLLKCIKMRFVVWVWNHTPSCAEMSRLASRSLEQPLPPQTWHRMKLHHLICVYFKQLKFLHAAAPQFDMALTELPRAARSMMRGVE